MTDQLTPLPDVPESREVPKKQSRLSLVWVIPIVAALAGVWVAVTTILSEGPKITLIFSSADGLEAGKTKIQLKGVDIGTITTIRLSEDHQRVIATAQMAPKTEAFLVEDSLFWVVRPRISGANVTGLGTLISGAYIGAEIGSSKQPRREFVALENELGERYRAPAGRPAPLSEIRAALPEHAALVGWVDFRSMFLVPLSAAVFAAVLLAVAFHPPAGKSDQAVAHV